MTAPKNLARAAGLLYLVVAVGVALIVGCVGYPAGVFTDFLAHDAGEGTVRSFSAVGGLSEPAFVAWLLVKGVRVPASRKAVPA